MFVNAATCFACPPISSIPYWSAEGALTAGQLRQDPGGCHSDSSTKRPQAYYSSELFYPSIIPLAGTWPQGLGHYSHSSLTHREIIDSGKDSEKSKNSCEKDLQYSPVIIVQPTTKSADLKFGIDRILSPKSKEETEEKRTGTEEKEADIKSHIRSSTSLFCPCSSPSHHGTGLYPPAMIYGTPQGHPAMHLRHPQSQSLSYHTPRQSEYPGPYAILSSDAGGSQSQQPKRKRSWSRAVFSNLQRKGLEKRFEVQKYVTKPDRRQLAAMLGLTDAQVKVWFQNRRMKWRHEMKKKPEDGDTKDDTCDTDQIKETTFNSSDIDRQDEQCMSDLESDLEDIEIVDENDDNRPDMDDKF